MGFSRVIKTQFVLTVATHQTGRLGTTFQLTLFMFSGTSPSWYKHFLVQDLVEVLARYLFRCALKKKKQLKGNIRFLFPSIVEQLPLSFPWLGFFFVFF